MWGRLRKTAKKGDLTLFIQGAMDWLPGDQVIIGTTGKDARETEWLTVFAKRHVMDSSVDMRCLVRELCEVDGQPQRADTTVRIAGPYELPFLLHGDGANLALPSSSTE